MDGPYPVAARVLPDGRAAVMFRVNITLVSAVMSIGLAKALFPAARWFEVA